MLVVKKIEFMSWMLHFILSLPHLFPLVAPPSVKMQHRNREQLTYFDVCVYFQVQPGD